MNLQKAIDLTKSKVEEAGDSCPLALREALEDLFKAALQDDKTPLGNAQALNLAALLVGTGGENPNVVVFGDLNHFHNFNRQHGSTIGDAAIAHVGKLIDELIVNQCQARAFRKSGDEFVMFLSSERLHQFESKVSSFAACEFHFDGELRETSMSFGFAVSEGEIGYLDLLLRAETACRIAKSRGDGISVGWSEAIEEELMFTIRGVRCDRCKAKIDCDVPATSATQRKTLMCCPYCSGSLVESTAREN